MDDASNNSTSLSHRAVYEDLFNRLKDCIFLLDMETFNILEANFACEQVFGIPLTQFVGKPVLDWIHTDEHIDFQKDLRIAKRRYYPRTIEHRFLGPEGKIIDMEVQLCPLRIAGENEVIQVIARDITFRRETERQIQELMYQLQAANIRLEQISTTDEMTGLYNFRHFKTLLQGEHERAYRYKSPYAIIFFDLDYFKKYNDRNGHPAGDRLLKLYAAILLKCCRITDIPARYGGEEFVVICPNTTQEGAFVLAERIRSTVESTEFEFSKFQPEGKLTVSVGVASYPVNGTTPDAILKASDVAVYQSKHDGRNRITISDSLKKEPDKKD